MIDLGTGIFLFVILILGIMIMLITDLGDVRQINKRQVSTSLPSRRELNRQLNEQWMADWELAFDDKPKPVQVWELNTRDQEKLSKYYAHRAKVEQLGHRPRGHSDYKLVWVPEIPEPPARYYNYDGQWDREKGGTARRGGPITKGPPRSHPGSPPGQPEPDRGCGGSAGKSDQYAGCKPLDQRATQSGDGWLRGGRW